MNKQKKNYDDLDMYKRDRINNSKNNRLRQNKV